MPISTIPVKWLKPSTDNYTSRFEVVIPQARNYETERSQRAAAEYYDYETTTTNKDYGFHSPQALVAQLAERRFRNSCARVNNNAIVIVLDRGGDLRSWVQIPPRAYLIIVVIITIRRGD